MVQYGDMDEKVFLDELARRINGFFESCPLEAREFFETRYRYQHEMKAQKEILHRQGVLTDEEMQEPHLECASVAGLLAAMTQTLGTGSGWVLLPILQIEEGGKGVLSGVQVVRQGSGALMALNGKDLVSVKSGSMN